MGAAPASAAVSPQPYLDSSYDTALWNELQGTWPSGYPTPGMGQQVFDTETAAGTLPASMIPSSLVVNGSGYKEGAKITRGSSSVFQPFTSTSPEFSNLQPTNAHASEPTWFSYTVPANGEWANGLPPVLKPWAGQTIGVPTVFDRMWFQRQLRRLPRRRANKPLGRGRLFRGDARDIVGLGRGVVADFL